MSSPLTQPLSEAEPGPVLLVDRLEANEKTCRRLREVGFCEKGRIQLLSRGGQIICNVCGTRLALSRALAKKIWVRSEAHTILVN
jgi:Fe2+ transport system protein FeoA